MKNTIKTIVILMVITVSFFTNCKQEKVSTIDPVLQDTVTVIMERMMNEINAYLT